MLGVPHNRKEIAANVHPMIRALLETQDAAGMTDRELGKRAGYAYQNLANWRTGGSRPTIQALSDFAEVFGYELRLVPKETK